MERTSSNIFLRNPYLAMVIAILIVLCGTLALLQMPLSQYPDVTPPQITVSIVYPGADAKTLLDSVIVPLEQEINGAPGLIYLQSTAADSGEAVITATFEIGTDPEVNRQNVQDRVNWANSQLPQAVQREGVIVRQQNGNILLGIELHSPDRSFQSLFLGNYASIHLVNELARIDGVSQVELFGGSDYAMRIWLDTTKCAALSLPVKEVLTALENQNLQVTSGGIGKSPQGAVQKFSYNVQVLGRLKDKTQFGNIIVRTDPNGAQVKLSDVAQIRLGEESYATSSRFNREESVILLIFQNAGANGLQIDTECRALMKKASKDFPPGMVYGFQYDSTNFVRAGIKDVVKTLLIAILLVASVSFLFLQDWRMMLIPTLAIPVSIVGSFMVLKMLGFSINMITLFALTLAIGIVVDDAIIVIENVSRLMDEEQLSPFEAASKSMEQITGAVVATTAVLLAMFVPLCFFPGITGEMYREFGVTLSIAVAISAFNALSLSPALCGLILKPHLSNQKPFVLFRIFNSFFKIMSDFTAWLLSWMLKWAIPLTLIYLLLAGLIFYGYTQRPSGFIPQEDQGYFLGSIQLRADASLESAQKLNRDLIELTLSIPGVSDVISIPGFNILNTTPAERNIFVAVILKPWEERARDSLTSERIMEMLQYRALTQIPSAFCMYFQPPAIPGIGMAGGFNLVLEERGTTDPVLLAGVVEKILAESMGNPKLSNVFSAYNANTPAIYLQIDRQKAMNMGVSMDSIDQGLQNELGFTFVNQFNRFGQIYKVELQAQAQQRRTINEILNLHVTNEIGQMVPLSSIATPLIRFSAGYLSRHNLHLAAQIQGGPAHGISSSEAMEEIKTIAQSHLLPGMALAWTDMSYQEASAGQKGPWILLLAMTFIFLFLAALYQSWLLPLSVLPVIPIAMTGALVSLTMARINNNLYTQIGLILLFGMACKTAILVVDFAKQRHRTGVSAKEAASYAQKLRFRAVLMTSLAFVFGTLPLAFSTGPGSAGQSSIGIPIIGGMIGTFLGGILLAPMFFLLTASILDWRRKKERRIPPRATTRATIILILPIAGTALLLTLGGCYTPPTAGSLIQVHSLKEAEEKIKIPAADLKHLTRRDAVRIALENNPTYRAALTAITGARMRYYQALGGYSPTLSVGGGLGQELFSGRGFNEEENGGSADRQNSFYLFGSVQANLLLFDGLAREFQWIAAKHQVRQNEFLSENAKRTLQQAVLTAYDEALSAQAQFQIAQSNLLFQKEELRQAEIKAKVGNAPAVDIVTFRGQYQYAEIQQIKAKNRERIARFSLALLLGFAETQWIESVTLLNDYQDENQYDLLEINFYLDQAISNRPDLNALRAGLDAQRFSHYQRYSSFSPLIFASANYTYSNESTYNSGSVGNVLVNGNSFNYGATAIWDLFDGFIRYHKLRQSRASLDQAYLQASAQWLQAVNEVRGAHADSQYALRWVRLASARRNTLLEERNIIQKEYRAGATQLIRFQQAQTQYVNSELELLESRITLQKALIRLFTASSLEDGLDQMVNAGKSQAKP